MYVCICLPIHLSCLLFLSTSRSHIKWKSMDCVSFYPELPGTFLKRTFSNFTLVLQFCACNRPFSYNRKEEKLFVFSLMGSLCRFHTDPPKASEGPQGWRWPGMVWARKGQLCPGMGTRGREPIGVPVCPAAPLPLPHPRYQTWYHIPQISKLALCINWFSLVLTLVTRESWKFYLKENIWVPFPATTCELIKWKTSPRKKI